LGALPRAYGTGTGTGGGGDAVRVGTGKRGPGTWAGSVPIGLVVAWLTSGIVVIRINDEEPGPKVAGGGVWMPNPGGAVTGGVHRLDGAMAADVPTVPPGTTMPVEPWTNPVGEAGMASPGGGDSRPVGSLTIVKRPVTGETVVMFVTGPGPNWPGTGTSRPVPGP
jgi:hypothetical protein